MTKTLKKLGLEGMCLNIMKAICDKFIANIILNGKKTKKAISTKVRNKTRVSTLSILIQYNFAIPSKSNTIRARHKRDSNREGRVKLLLFTDGTTYT
jgi:hypothetical protein